MCPPTSISQHVVAGAAVLVQLQELFFALGPCGAAKEVQTY